MATATKPDIKGTYPSWFENLHAEGRAAEDSRNLSYDHRQLVRATRIETDIKTKYDQLDTNNRLSDRIWTVRQWRDELINQLNRLKERMTHLRDAKHVTEEFIVKLNDTLGVNTESLTNLDRRRNGENIDDPVFQELNKVSIIQGCPLSPFLFNFIIDILMDLTLTHFSDSGIDLLPGNDLVDLEHADDIVLLGEDAVKIQQSLLNTLSCNLRMFGMRFAPGK
ncbi:unnamed protein product [Trichobilharzia regenti]|nr:unnamed protein product [Trichobilharzia regenti]